MELGPQHGTWVSVEDGVEVLHIQSGGDTSDASDESNGVQVIEARPCTRMSSKRITVDLEVPVCPSKRQRNSPSCSTGLLSKCGHQNAGNVFLTSCMHNTCRECLKSKVESVANKSMVTLEPSYDEIKVQLLCPDQRCGIELGKVELTDLLGIDLMKEYENWLRIAFNDVYGTSKVNCIKCQQGMAIKCPMMPSIKRKGKAKVSDDMNRFCTAPSDGRTQCPESWMCQNCNASWCAACGFAFDSKGEVSGSKGSHFCSEANNYLIWDIVGDLKLIYNDYTKGSKTDSQPDSTSKADDGQHKTDKPIDQPGASFSSSISSFGMLTGMYGSNNCKNTVWGAGTGFGGNRRESKSTQDKVRKMEKELDRRTETVLKSLTNVLKNIAGNRLQHILGFTEYVLLGSDNALTQLLAFLVTNDSMMDICARGPLYMQLAELLKAMAPYQELLSLLKGSSFQTDRNEDSDVHGNNGSDTSIINKLKKIYEQSKIIVNRFKDGKHDTVEADIDISRCLLECYEQLAIAAKKQISLTAPVISVSDNNYSGMTGDSEEYSSQTSSDEDEDGSRKTEKKELSLDQYKKTSLYKETLKPLQFGEYPMLETKFRRHTYSKHFNELGSNKESIDNKGEHNKKRMLHIAKEIASLVTNLPLEWESSIHARVDPVRMDLLKALIVGPRGTPYQNGVFLFDIYLPPDYPQVPPKVTFLTTGCGKVRFNPNLYADGKVCLSLLGTWDGPSWQPWKSTLLQVLVSIQSLIFVADPYYNEPGHEVRTDSRDAAEEENITHRCNTLKYAILDALRDPDPSFKDVIITHFQHKTEEIIEQCSEWVNNASDRSKVHSDTIQKIADDVLLEVVKVSPL